MQLVLLPLQDNNCQRNEEWPTMNERLWWSCIVQCIVIGSNCNFGHWVDDFHNEEIHPSIHLTNDNSPSCPVTRASYNVPGLWIRNQLGVVEDRRPYVLLLLTGWPRQILDVQLHAGASSAEHCTAPRELNLKWLYFIRPGDGNGRIYVLVMIILCLVVYSFLTPRQCGLLHLTPSPR